MKADQDFRTALLEHVSDEELQAIVMAYIYAVAYRARSELGDMKRLVDRLFPDGAMTTLAQAMQPIAEGQFGDAAKRLNAFALSDKARLPNLRDNIAMLARLDKF
ncbi:MAG: hypothetical protein R3D02_08970 [Hyphomicrobiales bacterium]